MKEIKRHNMTRRLTILAVIGALLLVPVFAMAQDPIKKPDVSKLRKQSTSSTTTSSSSSATPKPTTGSLSVQYTPNGASVYVDGTEKGVTPCEISGLSVGSHTVKISLRGYETATRTVSITANGVREIAGTLTKQAVAATTTSSTISGHSYVDLGLSVKWATMNVGASSPEGYGDYYAWGEKSPKSSYDEDNSKTYGKSSYNHDIGGDSSTDAARANWGGSWRLPTAEEFRELIDNCNWTWTTLNGKAGYKVVSKKNGNSIFFPAAGYRSGTSLYYAGESGYYWSSTPIEDYSYIACILYFNSRYHNVGYSGRDYGRTVRPVSE